MLPNAATGSPKNIAPVRLIATSKSLGRERMHLGVRLLEAHVVQTLAGSDVAEPRSIIRAERSTPRAQPELAARAASRVVCPVPQPMSSTRSAAAMSAASRNAAW